MSASASKLNSYEAHNDIDRRLDEHQDRVAEMLESCAKRIIYNYPKTGSVRWLDDSVGRPKIIAMRVENLN
jgi:hypothetical protein